MTPDRLFLHSTVKDDSKEETMKKLLTTLGLAAALAAPVGVYAASRHCTLTGQDVDPCCCVVKDGKLTCTLTGKTLDKCCCE